jgi:hypothetical protein
LLTGNRNNMPNLIPTHSMVTFILARVFSVQPAQSALFKKYLALSHTMGCQSSQPSQPAAEAPRCSQPAPIFMSDEFLEQVKQRNEAIADDHGQGLPTLLNKGQRRSAQSGGASQVQKPGTDADNSFRKASSSSSQRSSTSSKSTRRSSSTSRASSSGDKGFALSVSDYAKISRA